MTHVIGTTWLPLITVHASSSMPNLPFNTNQQVYDARFQAGIWFQWDVRV